VAESVLLTEGPLAPAIDAAVVRRSGRASSLGVAFLFAIVGCAAPRSPSPAVWQVPAEDIATPEECAARMQLVENRRWETPKDCSLNEPLPSVLTAWQKSAKLECDLTEEFRAYVAPRRSCAVAEDCAVVATECPFGCGIAAAKASARDIRLEADELVRRYRAAGIDCKYQCSGATKATCRDHRCVDARPFCLPKSMWNPLDDQAVDRP
jgi:hypothetical protein